METSATTISYGTTRNKKFLATSRTNKYLVFLVEDSDVYCTILEHFIKQMTNTDLRKKPKVEIKSFGTGEECLENMYMKPDIVVVDYFLNEKEKEAMDGLKLLKKIKSVSPRSKVIAMSSQKNLYRVAEFFNQGADDYIVKEEQGGNRLQNSILRLMKSIDKEKKEYWKNQLIIFGVFILGIIVGVLI